jgi:uncharacterized membrane protein YjjP (DUF1212 family)
MSEPVRETAAAEGFVLRLGRALHTYGYPAPGLEDSLVRASARLGLVGQFFSTPTSLFAAFGVGDAQRTYLSRVEPGDVNLGKLARLDESARLVMRGTLAPAEGSDRIETIVAARAPYPRIVRMLAFGAASGAACRLLGGGFNEVAVAAGIGLLIGLLERVAAQRAIAGGFFELAAACLASLVANAAAARGLAVSVSLATLAGLIVLVPGFSLTIAMAELAARHLASGTARLAGAFMAFIGMTFGVALGRQVSLSLAGAPANVTPSPLPEWTLWAALAGVGPAFAVLLRAERRDVPWIVLTCLIGFSGSRLGSAVLGAQLGACVGALAVGLAAHAFERWRERPALVLLVPGVLLLVPGSFGFRSFALLLDQKVVVGVDAAFTMLLTATSLVAGLLLAEMIVGWGDRA